MEPKYQHTINGQSVLQADLNAMGDASALADDRVLAELLRLTPYDGATVARGIVPYAHASGGGVGLIAPNGASGNVKVNPFRAIVGSRTAVATDAKKNWRDIRSAIAVGSTTLHQLASFAANASGNARWDLIYAAVAVDANTASVTRKVKDPTTKAITGQLVVTQVVSSVTIGVVTGTPAASPQFPATPADAGGTYNIPIAFVRIPNGFGASSTVLDTDIAVVAPCLQLSSAAGNGLLIASSQFTSGGVILTSSAVGTWGASGTRPGCYVPSSMTGATGLIIAVDSTVHVPGDIVDTRDWRGRLVKAISQSAAPANNFVWESGSGAIPPNTANAGAVNIAATMGALNGGVWPLAFAGTPGQELYIYCNASTGQLHYGEIGGFSVDKKAIFWLEFSGVFENYNA